MLSVPKSVKPYFEETVSALVAAGIQKADAEKELKTKATAIQNGEKATAWHTAWTPIRKAKNSVVWACNEKREQLGLERKSPRMVQGLKH